MPTCLCIGGLVLVADAAAWVLSAQTGDSRWVVLITSGSTVIVALLLALVKIAPYVGGAITSLGASILPALAAIRKQNEELNKGTLSERIEKLLEQNQKLAEQNEKLQATIEDDRTSTNKARETLHAIRNEFQNATLQHAEQRAVLIAQVGDLTKEIAELRRREHARLDSVDADQVRQDVKIEGQGVKIEETKAATAENTAAIERIAGNSSTEILVVKVDEPRDNP
jgi:predicted RNase H-like nuclease (RuvC/YqgF family)